MMERKNDEVTVDEGKSERSSNSDKHKNRFFNDERSFNNWQSPSRSDSQVSVIDSLKDEQSVHLWLAGDGLTMNFNKYLNYEFERDGSLKIRHSFFEVPTWTMAEELAKCLECYNQRRLVYVIQRNYQYADILQRQLRKMGLYTLSVGANKPNEASLAKCVSILRPAITTMEYLATNPDVLPTPEVIFSFDHNIPRMFFLERFIRYRHQSQTNIKRPTVVEVYNFTTPNAKLGMKIKELFSQPN